MDAGEYGDMTWMAKSPGRRADPREVLPGVRSVVVVALNYYRAAPAGRAAEEGVRGRIARYEPNEAQRRAMNGSVIVDLRSHDERARDGVVPGSVHVPRSVLEWRAADLIGGFDGWRDAGLETIAAPPVSDGLPGMGGPDR